MTLQRIDELKAAAKKDGVLMLTEAEATELLAAAREGVESRPIQEIKLAGNFGMKSYLDLETQLTAAQRENAELRKDKERLDWLGTRRHIAWSFAFQGGELTPTSVVQHPTKESLRTAIDAAMKEKA